MAGHEQDMAKTTIPFSSDSEQALDPFARLADKHISNPVKSRMKAAKTREENRRKKQEAEQDYLYTEWKKWREEHKTALMNGEFGAAIIELCEFIERMTIEDAPQLLTLVKAGPWKSADLETRQGVLSLIGRGIIYVREAEGYDPFDDSLPFTDEEATVFELCREWLR